MPPPKDYIPVRAVMNPDTMLIEGLATVHDAVETMRRHGVSSLVIDKRYETDEYGLLVITDIAKKLIAHDRSAHRTNVYEIMTKPVLTVEADMDVKYAIRMLQQFGVSRALVLDKGSLCGIVTLRDMVLRYLLPPVAPEGSGLADTEGPA